MSSKPRLQILWFKDSLDHKGAQNTVNQSYTSRICYRMRNSQDILAIHKYALKSYRLLAQVRIQIRVRIRAQLIIRKGAETGGATGVGKIRTDRSVKRQRSANSLCIPAIKPISYLNKLWKLRRSGVISRSLVRCCRYELSLKHFIFFAHRMSLRLSIRATQEEAGERLVCSYR